MNYTKVSHKIAQRLIDDGQRFFSNDNISAYIEPGERKHLVDEVTAKMEQVLQALVIDTDNDHNAQDTARRYAKMLVNETFAGRYDEAPDTTFFPNEKKVNELHVVGPIEIRSACAHHHVPILGYAMVGVLPGEQLIGLSKYHRIIGHIASRPQIQEEMTAQIADHLEELIKPKALAVLVVGNHMCCGHRGVKDSGSRMSTAEMRGLMITDKSLKDEFYRMVDLNNQSSK